MTARLSEEERSRRDWDRRLRRAYGIGVAEYEAMEAAQRGVCAICGKASPRPRRAHGKAARRTEAPRLAVDHDHESGVVRGLLCSNCNHKLIGRFKDPAVLRAAAAYLEDPPAQRTRQGTPPPDVQPVDLPASNEAPLTDEDRAAGLDGK